MTTPTPQAAITTRNDAPARARLVALVIKARNYGNTAQKSA